MHPTYTYFGRHADAFAMLEDILKRHDTKRFNSILIGVGSSFPESLVAVKKVEDLPYYSYEYIELALLLERVGKPWSLTVADKSKSICEEVKSQKEIMIEVVNDNNLHRAVPKSYWEKALEGLVVTDRTEIATEYMQHYATVCKAKIPESIRSNLTVVKMDITNHKQVQDWYEMFSLVICHNVIQYVKGNKRGDVKARLADLLMPGGVISFGSNDFALSQLPAPLKEVARTIDGIDKSVTLIYQKQTNILYRN